MTMKFIHHNPNQCGFKNVYSITVPRYMVLYRILSWLLAYWGSFCFSFIHYYALNAMYIVLTAKYTFSKLNIRCFTLEYSCANLLYFVCRSVTLAIFAENVIPLLLVDASKLCPR